jgi:methylthioribulose-1-phosphate dehydratase
MAIEPASSITEVVRLARRAAARGWAPATSGNFSARIDGARAAITTSGVDKGELSETDVLVVDIDAPLPPRASAEAPLHLRLYRDRPEIGAVAHVHSPAATAISLFCRARGAVHIVGLELAKAFRGVTTHEAALAVPVLDNDQDMDRVAGALKTSFFGPGSAPGFLLAGHGLYAWGRDPGEVWRHLEAFDFLFEVALRMEQLGR